MNYNIPIYLANIKVQVTKKTGPNSFTSKVIKINEIFLKGFNFPDMIRRKGKSITSKYISSPKDKASIIDIEILSQHGYGVDDGVH